MPVDHDRLRLPPEGSMQSKMLRWSASGAVAVAILALVSGCGGAAQASTSPSGVATATAAATPSPAASASASLVASPTAGPVASATPAPSGAATLDTPPTVAVGAVIDVAWTGPNAEKDYITVVAVGTTKWTTEKYFYTRDGSPGKLPAPTKVGDYEIWYVNGADDIPKARRPITVTAFVGTVEAPAEVQAGSSFQVAWTGPGGPGDYITIVEAGATKWTTEVYFYTKDGNPGTLVAPIKTGAYEVWYVTGQDPAPQVRRPLTVTPYKITLEAPAKVKAGAGFTVKWTGPNGPRDYVTIVPAGSPEGTYLDYAYTASGPSLTLTAPDKPGDYEIWYASDRVHGTFARIPIVVE